MTALSGIKVDAWRKITAEEAAAANISDYCGDYFAAEEISAVSDSSGNYTISGLIPGEYYIRVLNYGETPTQPYETQEYNNCDGMSCCYTLVTVTADATTPNIDFVLIHV